MGNRSRNNYSADILIYILNYRNNGKSVSKKWENGKIVRIIGQVLRGNSERYESTV